VKERTKQKMWGSVLELHFGKSPEGSGMIEATCNTFPGPEAPSQPPPTDQNGVPLRRPWMGYFPSR